jgi:MFS transporter, DHA1 family, inner membrane transport protein
MNIFGNSDINRVYVHSGLQSLAFNLGGAFIWVYLLKAGVALPLVFVCIAAVVLFRLVLRLGVVPVIKRLGLRKALMIGTVLDAASFLVLAKVDGTGPWLIFYLLSASLGTTFYWTCFHSMVARLGDEENRGAQVSTREAIFALASIVGPLVGGLTLTFFGPVAAFVVAALVYFIAVIPLLGVPEMDIEKDVDIPRAAKVFAASAAFSDGVVAASVNFGWRIVLFQTLGENFQNYGSALAIAGVVGAVAGLALGKMFDLGHHKRSLQIGMGVMVIAVLAEAFGFHSVWSAVAANMIGAVAGPIYMSAMMSQFYNVGKASGCTLRFNIYGENGFDLGAGSGALFTGLLLWLGFGYFWPLIIGLFGCAALYAVLRRNQLQAAQ